MRTRKQLVEKILRLIQEQDDKIVNLRGVKGYGVGHPYAIKSQPTPVYGYIENEDEEKQFKPVKISKAFRKKKND
jgi:hypothetical protein